LSSQSNIRRAHEAKLEQAFQVLEGTLSGQESQAVEQTRLLRALVDQLTKAIPSPVVPLTDVRADKVVCSDPSQSSTDQPDPTPTQSIPFPDGSFIGNGGSSGSNRGNKSLAGGSNGNTPHVDPSIIKPQLPLIQPRLYKSKWKDNACEQWCMDMHSFLRRFEILTGKYLSIIHAIKIISQYFAEVALT
jgi:hypothetical protein